uniref:Putative ionotropic receptor n=1 Tax=Reticulitermes speratus TaxID=60591 RepID=A0A0U5BQ72_9NEOP
MTLASTALPRYRAIMGPFHWTVWLALTLTYLLAIFPISFSYSHSLTSLLKDPWQVENMFWYVFGTFTNCFTFKGERSWSNSDKAATRMLIGWYWIFSIIISACYTGCIIAFVTLPVYPSYVDNGYEVLYHGFKVGTLSDGGWRHWFNDSADPVTTKLFEKMEYLPDLESALHNITTAYYRDYAFLGSSSLLDYIIRINYTKKSESKRSYLHLGTDCFVPFNVALIFKPRSPHSNVMSQMLLRIIQSGLSRKLTRDLEWDLRRSASGKLLAASSGQSLRAARVEERKLTLEDVTGMFLLLGAGFGIAAFVLFIETVVWIIRKIKKTLFPGEKCDQAPPDLDKSCDMGHEAENNERYEKLVYDYRAQPGFRKRRVYSADAIFKTCEDTDEISHNTLQFFIPLHSMTSLPITSSPKLENTRLQTPRPNDTFTIEKDAEMSGDKIPEDRSYNGYGKYEEDSSRRSEFHTEKVSDKYFGAKVQEQSYHMFEEVASGHLGLRDWQDVHSEHHPNEQEKDMAHSDRITL